jgi:hypothetical protein
MNKEMMAINGAKELSGGEGSQKGQKGQKGQRREGKFAEVTTP